MMDKEFARAIELGVSSPYAKGIMTYTKDKDGRITVDYADTLRRLAMDAAPTVTASVGVPAALTTYIDPEVVSILFTAQNAREIFVERKTGDWTDKTYVFTVEEYSGNVTPYSDYAENVSSDVGYEFPERQNFLFQTVIKYGDLEGDMASRAKLSLASAKQRAAAFIIANAQNKFYLYGVAGKRIYGLLNDPNLPASETPVSVDGNSTWADKAAANPDQVANIVYNDINKLWASLTARNGGNVNANSPIVLAFSNAVSSFLTTPNSFGLTAKAMLQSTFPNIKFVELPELSTDSGEMLYMTVPTLFGVDTGVNAYSEKLRLGRVIPQLSSFKQKAISGTWGAIIQRPSLIATMVGV